MRGRNEKKEIPSVFVETETAACRSIEKYFENEKRPNNTIPARAVNDNEVWYTAGIPNGCKALQVDELKVKYGKVN